MLPTTTRSPSPTTSPRRPLPSELTTQIDRFVSDLLQELQPIAHSDNGLATTPRPIRVEPTTPEPGLGAPVDLQALIEDVCRLEDECSALITAVRHDLIDGSSAPSSPDTDRPSLAKARKALRDLLSRTMALHTSATQLPEPNDKEPTSRSDSDSDTDSESSGPDKYRLVRELGYAAQALQDLIGMVELAERSEPRQSPGTSFLQAMVDERNRLMDDFIARSAAMPPDSDLPAITQALAELHGMHVQLADLDHRIVRLLAPEGLWYRSDPYPESTSIIEELRRSDDDRERSVRLFQIAELEGQLRKRGIRFEPGQLGVIHHDDTVGPFPAKEALRLAQLHAEDDSDAGLMVATRLLAAWSHHVTASWDLRDVEPTLLEVYVELAEEVSNRRNSKWLPPRTGPSLDGAPIPGEAEPLYRYRGLFCLQNEWHSYFPPDLGYRTIILPHLIDRMVATSVETWDAAVATLALNLEHRIREYRDKLPQYMHDPAARLAQWMARYKATHHGLLQEEKFHYNRIFLVTDGLSKLRQAPILDPSKKNFG